MLARRASVSIQYLGTDITEEISQDLLSFTYTDNAVGNADNISISLKDDHKKWVGDWFPSAGDSIEASINVLNWRREGDDRNLKCGKFFVDQPEFSGRPSVLTIGAISAPLTSSFMTTNRSRVWKNIMLRSIADDIAKRAGLSLQFIGSNNPRYKEKEQTETSDSAFLLSLCEEEGLAMKTTHDSIVIFDEREFEQRPAIATIKEWNDTTISYSFVQKLHDTAYDGCRVKYQAKKEKKIIQYLYKPLPGNKILEINQKVEDTQEARRLAEKSLRMKNKEQTTGTLSLIGNVDLVAGSCINIEGFGKFDGKYFIQNAVHTIGQGYTTDIEIRKVLEGY